jgi:hypothetical protein
MNKLRLSRLGFGPLAVLALGTLMTLGCSDVSDETATTDIGLLLTGTITASSTNGTTNTPAKAGDGNTGTRWESRWNSNNEWLKIDLGSIQSIGGVKIIWEGAYASAYQVQTSNDDASWTIVRNVTAGDGGTDDFTGLTASGRFVRMLGIARKTPTYAYGYSIYEMQISAGSGGTGAAGTTGAATS